jgi:hypothetical protein
MVRHGSCTVASCKPGRTIKISSSPTSIDTKLFLGDHASPASEPYSVHYLPTNLGHFLPYQYCHLLIFIPKRRRQVQFKEGYYHVAMSAAAPSDGGTDPEHLKDKLKHPFHGLREKFRDTKLYDLKVGLIHKKYVHQ